MAFDCGDCRYSALREADPGLQPLRTLEARRVTYLERVGIHVVVNAFRSTYISVQELTK